MKIKSYSDFISEELVLGLKSSKKKTDDKTNNVFKTFFNSSSLELKEFLQSKMPNQNLKFLGAGSVGLAFEWYKSPQLPKSFFSSEYELKFIGQETDYQGKVIKFTADVNEFDATLEIMKKTNNGKNPLDSFVNFFWIKEVQLDKRYQKKVGSLWREEDQRLQDLLSNRRIKSKLEPNRKNDLPEIDLETRKSKEVTQSVFIICLEKLEMLNDTQKVMAEFFTIFRDFIDVFKPSKESIEVVYNWIMYNDNETMDFLGDGSRGASLRLKKKFREANITFQQFEYFLKSMCKIFVDGQKNDIPVTDIHPGNLGFRGDNLVAFDCM
jgi:hypothetical protein